MPEINTLYSMDYKQKMKGITLFNQFSILAVEGFMQKFLSTLLSRNIY